MASSSDRKLNSSASRASKPTFRRAGGRSGAPAKPQRNTIAHSKSVGHARQTSRPVVGSQLGNRPAAKKVLASLGDVKACYGRQACPSYGNS